MFARVKFYNRADESNNISSQKEYTISDETNCCKKCGSVDLYTEEKGNNIGLYCNDCGTWIKWLGKDEVRAFTRANRFSDTELLNKALDLLHMTKKELITR